ncbi:Probable RNA-directed DNA polymerase from transposon BS [Eumeta japonica]|uniref:Probable RNA-directed DNA polymerase from transposon BS n=1 Tax=Eumeta variegata TaxID=151549 RepID=A0A4C1XD63_EUMVA|nr:Probable RNA-directed DNA polymerase from transposon BS [Eumeta japonica]
MVHGPCGELNRSSPSTKDDVHEKCTKRYSKPFLNKTVTGEDRYPKYRRRSPEQSGFAAKMKIRGNEEIQLQFCSSVATNYKYLRVTLDKNLHFRDHIERVRNTALFYKARLEAMLGRKSKLSRRNKRTIYKMCIRTVMTYVSRLRSRRSKALHRLQVIHNKFCRAATDTHWCVRNSILHRDLELPLFPNMKDASKRFFDIAGSHPNALLRAAVGYQPPPPIHLIRRPRNVLTDPPDALTEAVESLNDEGREPTRDGFLRHPMPRRLLQASSIACHAPSALACAVRPHSVKLSKSSDLSSDSSRPTK